MLIKEGFNKNRILAQKVKASGRYLQCLTCGYHFYLGVIASDFIADIEIAKHEKNAGHKVIEEDDLQ